MQDFRDTIPNGNPVLELIAELQKELAKLQAAKTLPMPKIDQVIKQQLARWPGAARREMVERTKLPPKTVSRALEELQANGVVVHVGDRRASRWFLTETLDKLTRP